ncbi:MAG: nickel-dependent lactate racemase [Firmicutes bacterium]|nr:nickel-dependent lactate racemase [Bacillota bacterium]
MKIEVGFGKTVQSVEVPDKNLLQILRANPAPDQAGPGGEEAVRQALANPIGSPGLDQIIRPGEKIVIITSDISRPMPTWDVMPALLDALYEAGAKAEDITLVFACGSHRGHTEEEQRHLAGERAWREIRCIDSDPNACIHLGQTRRGTPIDIMEMVAKADRRICVGNIEYHYFAGYSGGAKALFPGTSTPEVIQANHSMMVDERAHAGNMDTNPLRQDIDEAAAVCGIDFIVNVVLDEHKKIVHAVAGDVKEAHRAGCRYLDSLYAVEIPERADIVIVSQGGAPTDANLYQTQKALDNSKHAIKAGGSSSLVGACNEGMGSAIFEEWMTQAEKPEDLIERIRQDFKLGGHKAAAIAQILKRADIRLVSEMDPDFVRSIFMEPYDSLAPAFADAMEKQGPDAKVIVMPFGGATLPVLAEK